MRLSLYRVFHLPFQRFIRIEGDLSLYLVNKKKLPTIEDVVGILARDKNQREEA